MSDNHVVLFLTKQSSNITKFFLYSEENCNFTFNNFEFQNSLFVHFNCLLLYFDKQNYEQFTAITKTNNAANTRTYVVLLRVRVFFYKHNYIYYISETLLS